MYIPKPYSISEEEALAFIRSNGFALLITQSEAGPLASHIPLLLTAGNGGMVLRGHVAKANPHWKNWKEGDRVLAVFQGPHTYISSSWYDHENVPTWNYQTVHVQGTLRFTSQEETLRSLKELTDRYEVGNPNPVRVEGMSEAFLGREILGLVGFEVIVEKVEGAFRLSQNRDAANYREIIRRLEERVDPASREVAEAMKRADPAKAGLTPDGR